MNITHKSPKNSLGFSIVELLIAMLIGLIVLTGLVTVFDTSSKMNRTQNGLARIQENGRYALSFMKQMITNTGYQYCKSVDNTGTPADQAEIVSKKIGWKISATSFMPGFPASGGGVDGAFDPAYMIMGHECSGGACVPSLTSLGADLAAAVPAVGVTDGARIAGTDVLTIRYISSQGREVDTIAGNTLNLTAYSIANPPTPIPSGGQVLLVGCNPDNSPPVLLDIASNSAATITTVQNPPQNQALMKAFNFQNDFTTMTFYVANNIIDGRSIPTLYASVNGVTNPIIEGVDALDFTYGVSDINGATQFVDATTVQAMAAANCWPAPQKIPGTAQNINPITGDLETFINQPGCGWRSVTSVDIHMLLNTIYNSSNTPLVNGDGTEQYRYSQYGAGYFAPQVLPSTIPHYNMHRREFFSSVSLKNVLH